MRYRCPVCLFAELPYPPADYHICPCCGTEFGNDDDHFTHHQLREMWVAGGAHWFFGLSPDGWNPWLQLIKGGHLESVPRVEVKFMAAANVPAVASSPTVVWATEPVYEVMAA